MEGGSNGAREEVMERGRKEWREEGRERGREREREGGRKMSLRYKIIQTIFPELKTFFTVSIWAICLFLSAVIVPT